MKYLLMCLLFLITNLSFQSSPRVKLEELLDNAVKDLPVLIYLANHQDCINCFRNAYYINQHVGDLELPNSNLIVVSQSIRKVLQNEFLSKMGLSADKVTYFPDNELYASIRTSINTNDPSSFILVYGAGKELKCKYMMMKAKLNELKECIEN